MVVLEVEIASALGRALIAPFLARQEHPPESDVVVGVGIARVWGGLGRVALEEQEFLPGGEVVAVVENRLYVGWPWEDRS